jgi:HAE1 family hydrophobic/amphiphilic exporter-1
MTSISTLAAAAPAALLLGPGGEVRAPMAVSVIGGVLVSTLLTLFVVPCFYLEAEKARAFLARHLGRRARADEPAPAHAPAGGGGGGGGGGGA